MKVVQGIKGNKVSIRSATIGFAALVPMIFKIPNQKKTIKSEMRAKGILNFLKR